MLKRLKGTSKYLTKGNNERNEDSRHCIKKGRHWDFNFERGEVKDWESFRLFFDYERFIYKFRLRQLNNYKLSILSITLMIDTVLTLLVSTPLFIASLSALWVANN